MIVVRANEVKGVVTPPPHNRELKVLLSPLLQNVADNLSIGMVILPPGESGDPHAHGTEQETWYVISGHGKLVIGTEEVDLLPDTIVVAPAGVEHQIMNPGTDPLKALFIFSPAGPEGQYI